MTGYAVSCGHEVTADAAAETLRAGGSAVDAAIAAAFAAMVAEPVLAGMLGGGFLMTRTPSGDCRLLDFFVQTPLRQVPENSLDFRALEVDFGTTKQEFHVGAGTVATPGIAPGLAEAHARFGKIPMKTLVEPACLAARQGVEVTGFQAQLLSIVGAIYTATPSARAMFCDGDNILAAGARYRNPEFADVLEEFAHEGPRFVTEGEVAQALVSLTGDGGHLTIDDLRRYRPEWRQPLQVQRGSARISLNPPPSLGGALMAFGLQALDAEPSATDVLRALEATTKARVEVALDKDAAAGTARLLDPALLARVRWDLAGRPVSTQGTTHISVTDSDGMGVALTLSNGTGAGMVIPGTGIMPNNMMGEADLMRGGFHAWRPDTRLASMMAPLAVDWPGGRFAMLGSGGSNRIRSALLQVLLGIIDRGQRLGEAIEAPRIHVEGGSKPAVDFEDVGGDAFRAAIMGDCPNATAWDARSMFFGGVHAVMADSARRLDAEGDPRRAGVSRVG